MNLSSITVEQLKCAIQIKQEIEALNIELANLLGTSTSSVRTILPKKRMSAEGRARIVAAQKARWARIKKETGPVPKRHFFMSEAARAKIAAAARARWVKAKAEGKKTL